MNAKHIRTPAVRVKRVRETGRESEKRTHDPRRIPMRPACSVEMGLPVCPLTASQHPAQLILSYTRHIACPSSLVAWWPPSSFLITLIEKLFPLLSREQPAVESVPTLSFRLLGYTSTLPPSRNEPISAPCVTVFGVYRSISNIKRSQRKHAASLLSSPRSSNWQRKEKLFPGQAKWYVGRTKIVLRLIVFFFLSFGLGSL